MRILYRLICISFIALIAVASVQNTFAQKKKKKTHRSVRDSIRLKVLQRDSLLRSFKPGDGSINSLLSKIEDYNSAYLQNNGDLARGFDTIDISQRLPRLENRMSLIKAAINNSSTMGYLVSIRDIVDHITDEISDWQSQLDGYNDQLDDLRGKIAAFKKDSTLRKAPTDSSLRMSCALRVQDLEIKWRRLDAMSRKASIKVGSLANRTSRLSILLIELNDQIDLKIHQFTLTALSNEGGYLWDTQKTKNSARLDTALAATFSLNGKLYRYFFTNKSNEWANLGSIVLLFSFLIWIVVSKRKIRKLNGNYLHIADQAEYIVTHPVISSLALASIVGVYFYDHPPQVFIQSMLLFAVIVVGVLIKNRWPMPLFRFWLVLAALMVLYTISDLMIVITYADRFLLLALSLTGIVAGFVLLPFIKKSPTGYPPYSVAGVNIFIGINILSVILNVAGRFSLAKIAGTTATFNLCLAMGFYLLIQIVMEALFFQVEANKSKNNTSAFLDFETLQTKFRDILVKVAAVLWLIALAKNLVIDDYLYDQASDFLSHPYNFSNTAFTLGSILLFVIIIWMSGLVARIISYFYDFSAEQTKLSPRDKKTRSSILLIRLTIFSIGFIVAINASGLPMDRITIIISALGVGIGFGLQNIVNNLVSGVILAFEKPIQVGDVIEVGGKSGTIKEIGIRSSKIDIGDGSELIVPNGDLISQHVTNWTLTNTYRRIEVIVGVAYGSDVAKVDDILKGIINNHEYIMKSPSPSVFLVNFSEKSVDFRLWFWTVDINKTSSLKSNVMEAVYTEFEKAGIVMPHL